MAQRVQIILEDDLDGGDATETVTFGLDGVTYEIDLNERNAAALRDALDEVDARRARHVFTENARVLDAAGQVEKFRRRYGTR